MISPTPKNGPFKGADLQVYQDGFCGPLPLNGIRKKVFFLIEEFCRDLVLGRTKFQFEGRIARFAHRVCRMLLLRPMGRRLLLSLQRSNQFNEINICFRQRACAYPSKGFIFYHPEKILKGQFYFLSQGSRFMQLESYVVLGHELIHLLNGCKGNEWKEYPPTEGDIYGDLNEQIVITGIGASPTHHGMTENGIRWEHGLLARYGGYGIGKDHPMFVFDLAYHGQVGLLLHIDPQKLRDHFVMMFAVINDQLHVLLHLEARGIKHSDKIIREIASRHSAVRVLQYLNAKRAKNLRLLKAPRQHLRRSLPTLTPPRTLREE